DRYASHKNYERAHQVYERQTNFSLARFMQKNQRERLFCNRQYLPRLFSRAKKHTI
ncbi:hypothetical protein, partial [Methylomonas albis]